MKSKFPGYFKLTDKEINKLWEKALFVFDANILLNLYRYSDETRDDFFKILEKIKDRIWIPHQSASEFFENRLNVISQQEKSYEEAKNALKAIENEFKNSRQHPFITQKLLKKFSNLSKEICEQLNDSKEFHNKRINQDDVLDKIETLFNEKVGNEYEKNQLEEIYKEGEVRFLDKIPPGYKDNGKKDNSSKDTRKYGDLVVWKQILDKSKELKQGIILITDDRKEDWWVRFKGKTLSPRPELKKEFQTETEQSFHMYQSDRFLEFATKYLNEEINENAIQEIRDLRRLDERKRLRELRIQKEYFKYKERREELLKQRILLEEKLKFIEDKRGFIESALKEQYLILDNSDPSAFDDSKMKILKRDLHAINRKADHINSNIEEIRRQEFKERIIKK
ncbi:PIN-like domain-containing protein [Tenacibaculum maritimum]|uniref:PIN-like domain-containing protein n=1 Tax=Tenacibaculum maritimum TaxID=107401 RepID=UPI0038777398